MSAQVQRGLSALAIAVVALPVFWYAFGLHGCSKASTPPGFNAAIYMAIFGPQLTIFITVPLLVVAFALGYYLRWKLSPLQTVVIGIALLALAAGLGFALAKPAATCGPI